MSSDITNQETTSVDVAIAGYGPVGQTLAAILGRAGWRVAVFERQPGIYPLPRACHLDGETMRILQSVGVAADLEPSFHPQSGYEFYGPTGDLMHRIDFTGDDGSGWRAGYFFFAPDLEAALDGAARAQDNVDVHFNHEVRGVHVGDDGVRVEVSSRDSGAVSAVHARYLVGADGANSSVRRIAGIGWQDFAYEAQWLVVDLRPRHADVTRLLPEACQILDPKRPVSAFRWIGPDHARLEFMLLPGEVAEDLTRTSRVWELLAPFEIRPDNAELIRQVVYTFQSLLADRFHEGAVFLAGDAAHLMPPFLGQGMCAGLRDAAALSWRLDAALRGRAGPALWQTYTDERRTHVLSVINGSIAVGQILGATPDTLGQERGAAELAADLAALPATMPPLRCGGIAEGADLAGEVFPQYPVTDPHGVATRFDDLSGRGWRVVVSGPGRLDGASSPADVHIGGQAVRVLVAGETFDDMDGRYEQWFSDHAVVAALVRPDSLVFGAAGSQEQLRSLLAQAKRLTSTSGVQS